MDRILLSFVLVLVMLAFTPAASARTVDAGARAARACSIDGTSGTDRLTGSRADDVVCARAGADRIRAGGGADVVLGGAGDDLLEGKSGADRLNAGAGNDRVYGGAGADDLRGGPGRDALGGGLGADKLSGGPGRDVVYFGQRRAALRVSIGSGANDGVAGERDDVRADVEDVHGGGGNDVLSGNGGPNRLSGGGGRDRLSGGRGNDELVGGGADDRLDARDGGAGPAALQIGGLYVDRVVCGEGEDTALVDPADIVDPDCENVVGQAPAPGNRAPTEIALSNASVPENALAGTTVGALSVDDPDAGDTHSFELVPGADDNASFQLVGTALRTAAVFNYEARSSYTVRIRAGDSGTPAGEIVRAFTIAVNDVNEPATITTAGALLPYTENDPATVVDGALTLTDVDDTSLVGATVAITAGFDAADELSFTPQAGITGSYDAGTGVLTLTGTRPTAEYEAALRSVAYRHAGDDPGGARSVTFQADDGDGLGPASTRDITVTAVNDAPTVDASAGSASFTEGGGPVAVDPDVAVSDPDSTMLTGATVEITNDLPEDSLAFTSQSGITGAYVNGVLTLSGPAPVAAYEAVLRSVTYGNSSSAPSTAPRTVESEVTDAGGLQGADTRDVTVAAANDAPAITTTAGAVTYTEGDPGTVVDSGLTLSDLDDTNLDGARVAITAGFDAGDDLLFTNQGGISGTYDAGTGVLALTGTSSVADYQTALRSIEYRHSGDNPAAVKTVELRADDGDGLGPASTRDIDVTRLNDAPQVTATGADLGYTENDGPIAIDGGLSVGDPDSTQLASATVAITANFQAAQDELGFTDENGIAGAYDDTTGVLTLSGAASVGDYRTALRSVTYTNVSEGPTPASRTITFQATDSDSAVSNLATRGIAITGVNDPPTAVDDTGTTDEDTVHSIAAPGVLANDTEIDPGDAKTVDRLNGSTTLTGTSAKGATVTINADGSYSYDPGSSFQSLATGETDTDTFTYRVSDGAGASSTATVTLTITGISDAPIANADSFDAIGNTALSVGTTRPAGDAGKVITGSVLANDTDPDTPPASLVVEAGTFPTTLGGAITFEADGNFTYHPDDGDVGATDTVEYTVSDGVADSTGTLSLPLAGQVWYVRNNEPAGGDGTSDAPFDTLAEAETASGTGDTVYVFDGDNTAVDLDTGYAMAADERLIGEHNGVSLSGHLLHAGTTNAHPTLTATNEDVVALASGATVDGFNIDPAGNGGGISGDTGTFTINDVNVSDGGTGAAEPGVEIVGTTAGTVSDLTVSTNGATGVRLDSAGAVSFAPAGTISITNAGGRALEAAGTNLGTSQFDSITVTGSGSGGVSLTNTTGTPTFTDLSLTTTSGATAAFRLSTTGPVTIPPSGTATVSATGGPAVDVTGAPGAGLDFDVASSTSSAGDGINLEGLGNGTFSAAGGTISGASGIAFDLEGGGGAITYAGNIDNGPGQTAEITGRTGGNVLLTGAIADSADAGGGISLSGNTGGATTITGASKVLNTTTSNALSLTSSDGHGLDVSGGGLDIDTTSGTGILAAGSGTIRVIGAANTVTSTTGRAIDVQDTDFAVGGLTFQAVSANGAPNGIRLNNTGTTSGMTVTGSGSTTQGGDNSGGTIQATTGHGISLTNTSNPSFRNLRLLNTGDSGVNGTQVSGFSFTDGTITGAGDASDENSITFDDSLTATPNLTGAVAITNNVISQTEAEGIDIQNWAGTISDAAISNNALSDTGDVATPGSAISLLGSGTATSAANLTRATIAGNTITDFRAGAGIQVRGGNPTVDGPAGRAGTAGSATDVIAITGNTMNGGSGGVANQPDRFFTGGAIGEGQGNFNLSNNGTAGNRIRNIDGVVIELQADGPVDVTSRIENNFINANNAVGSAGIAVGTDDPLDQGAGTHSTVIQNNNVMGTDGPGIFPIVRDSGSTMTARVLNNTVAAPNTTSAARAGIRVDSGSATGDTTLCLELSGNTTAGSTNSGTGTTSPGINLRKQGTDPASNTFGIEGLSPSPTGTPNIENHVNGLNSSTTGTFGVGGTALLSATSGFTSCVAP